MIDLPRPSPNLVEIDGQHGEGGGQILRTALALAGLLRVPCRIVNIRLGRRNPGLRPQHLAGVRAVAALTGGRVEGDREGSLEVIFYPGKILMRDLRLDIGTAGSVTLLLQALLPVSLRSSHRLTLDINGGTDVPWSPPVSYLQKVFCPVMEWMGLSLDLKLVATGFYPKGGGRVRMTVRPGAAGDDQGTPAPPHPFNLVTRPRPLDLTRPGRLLSLEVVSLASQALQGSRVAERQVEGFRAALQGQWAPDLADQDPSRPLADLLAPPRILYPPTRSIGSSIQAQACFEHGLLGAGALGERGKPAEQVGEAAARALVQEAATGACLDQWMADQFLVYAALASGPSRVRVSAITSHCLTNLEIISAFLPAVFSVDHENLVIHVDPGPALTSSAPASILDLEELLTHHNQFGRKDI